MKRILLYGANGRTGHEVLTQALTKGYAVNVLVRQGAKVDISSSQLKVYTGSPDNVDDITKAMQGCDAVISTLGGLHQSEILKLGKIDPPHILEKAMRATIRCMKNAGIKRIIVQTALGAGDSYDHAPWIMRTLIRYTKFGIVYADHNMQEQLLQESDLDWTIVRPVGLTDKQNIKALNVTLTASPPGYQISRKHTAKFMLGCLERNEYVKQAPIISEG